MPAVAAAALIAAAGCSSSSHPASSPRAKDVPSLAATQTPAAKAAELGAGQLPGGARQGWKAAGARSVKAPREVRLNECAAVAGAASWRQLAHTGKNGAIAVQDTFTFADPARARRAYDAVVRAMGRCQARSRAVQTTADLKADAVVAPAARTGTGRAWTRIWTAVNTQSADGRNSDRVYLARHAAAVTVLQVTEPGSGPGAARTTADRTVLTALAHHLGAQADR